MHSAALAWARPNPWSVCFLRTGFIDFIVDPSFQVMGDMLEKIIIPLQRRNNTISEEAFEKADKATSTTSLSSRCSTPATPKSPLSAGQSPEGRTDSWHDGHQVKYWSSVHTEAVVSKNWHIQIPEH